MTRTWKCLLGAVAVCALLNHAALAQVIESNDVGVVRMQPADPNPVQPANSLYGEQEQVWLNDFQPPPGYGVDPVTIPRDNNVGYAVTSNVEDILYRIDRVNRHYHGLDGGWTGINAFVPMRTFSGGASLLAIDSRAFVSDYGRGGLNLGFVGRHYMDKRNQVLGVSAWFDYDEAHQASYAQAGLVASMVGPYWSLRANLQTPIGQSHERFNKTIVPNFFQDVLLLQVNTLQETAYQQFDFEFAVPTPGLARYGFETGIQYYFLNGAVHGVEDGHGIGIRNEAQLTEDVWLNAYVSSDGVFGSNLSINLQVTLPNGAPSRFMRRLPPRQYLVASDKRPYRVLTDTTTSSVRSTAIDSRDGDPIRVAHIDPNLLAAGADGTFETPFGSLAAFTSLPDSIQDDYDVILIRGRNDGTDTNLDTTITLFDGQYLLGTGIPQFVDTTLGVAPLPDLPFGTPILSNFNATGVDVVTLADDNTVSGLTIDATFTARAINGLGLQPGEAGNPGVRDFDINRNLIRRATVGVDIDVENSVFGEPIVGNFSDNTVELTSDDGLRITYDGVGAPSDTLDLTIRNNLFQGTLGQAIDIDLSGSAVATFDISDNELFLLQQNEVVTGVNFLGQSSSIFDGFPPDTMGAVGPEHIVEMINIGYAVYDKETGALIESFDTLDEFWIDAGAVIPLGAFTFDPRVVYDPDSQRWFAVAIDDGIAGTTIGNNVYVAVSNSSDPTDGWKAFTFIADTVEGTRFADYPTLGIDKNGVYIATNNFGLIGIDVSVYSIPKADLLGPTPHINNLARFENLNPTDLGHGTTLQPVVDFNSDGPAEILSNGFFGGGNQLIRTDLNGTAGANPTISLGTNITVAPFTSIGFALTPGAVVDALETRFCSNVVKVGNSIWAAHAVDGDPLTTAGQVIRWYEIDAATNTVLQTGDISDPNIEFIMPSVAVNELGQVVIGFSGTGLTQFPSSMAAIGQTVGGVTTFNAPIILAEGDADYFNFRWGDYSATVVDPSSRNGNTFWTFQERTISMDNEYGVQITQLTAGLGGNDGIFVNARDTAMVLAGSHINRNTITGGLGTGISVTAEDSAFIDLSGSISDNVITRTGTNGIFLGTSGDATLLVSGARNSVTDNLGSGLRMQSAGTSLLTVNMFNSQFDNNGERGIIGKALDFSELNFSFSSPFDPIVNEDDNMNGLLDPGEDRDGDGLLDTGRASASNNGGPGIEFQASGFADLNVLIDDVLVEANVDAGIMAELEGFSTGSFTIINSDIINTANGADPDLAGDGILFATTDGSLLEGLVAANSITDNDGAGIRALALLNSEIDLHDPSFVHPSPPNAAPVRGIFANRIAENGSGAAGVGTPPLSGGIIIDRLNSAVVTADVMQNLVEDNIGTGMYVRTSGGTATPPGGDPETRVFARGNAFTDTVDDPLTAPLDGEGVVYESNGASALFTEFVGNLVDGNSSNGIRVSTNGSSFFGITPVAAGDIGLPSIFDSNTVTDNGGAGFLLQNSTVGQMVIDITSIEAAINPDLYAPTLIARNFDGIRIEHSGVDQIAASAVTSIRVGSAFTPFPDVTIEENTDDAIDIDILPGSGGTFNFNISNSLVLGGRAAGALADPGISITHQSSFTRATIVIGGDISDAGGPFGLPRGPTRDAAAGIFDNDAYTRAGVIISDFAGDGINVVYTNSDETGSELNLRLFDSIVGQSIFGFNTGDGLDITVDDAGDPSGFTGLDVIVDNTDIVGNQGHGIFLRTDANNLGTLFPDGVDALDGALLNLLPGQQSDSNNPPNGIGDTIRDGPVGVGFTTSDDFINSLPFVLDPAGNDNGWADLTSPDDFIADLQVINGSRVDGNGLDGLHLEIGTATRQRVSLQNSSFSGNGDFEFDITTFASFEPDNDDVDRGEGMIDTVGLDPTAKLDFFFGSLDIVRDTPAGFPEPAPPVPAEFLAAVGGEGFNTSSSTRVFIDYVSDTAVGFQNASTFKGAPRPANLFIRALIPDDGGIIDDVDIPTPNKFLNNGAPFDEILFFLNPLPASTFPDRYLQLSTP